MRHAGARRGRSLAAWLAALVEDLPDEDMKEGLEAQVDACRFGDEPRREEAEYPALLAEARE
ncbi:hypothetical protein STTU_4060 [Streptomyces sp. Tu6071]|uniref:hypothetical protein n=1 Tax=Streptomyces sp. Tu6071 TaxID=355249 RepID=UPI00020E634B|nr:hypothetical protein [Streptomyces sp. Tu6071]EGJ76850.1 hypothetical protein STTU_4060 [Streptomyces sp. Tu6071]